MTTSEIQSLAGQLFVVGFPATTPTQAVVSAAAAGALGGVILFKRNIASDLIDVARLNADLAGAAGGHEPLLIAVDQEGGRVARIGPPAMKLPPMISLEASDDAFVEALAAAQSRQLRALGFTMNFAPVLDVHSNESNPIIGDRAFSRDATRAASRALAFAKGMRAGGLLSCGKHFPGHGDTSQDSHLDLPTVAHDRARLDDVELAPFRAAAPSRVDALMTAHVVYPALCSQPATLSRRIATELLRGELGFTGVLFSDDLEMKALSATMSYGQSAVRAIEAGCDALLVCSQEAAWHEAREAVAERASRDGAFRARCEEAKARFVAMRRRCAPTPITDAAQLSAHFGTDEQTALQARAWVAR